MRIWSIHPKYLDTKRLVAVWREGLLAKAVLEGKTTGYRNHPQLDRFKGKDIGYINTYLFHILLESKNRGYNFDETKIGPCSLDNCIEVTKGQIMYEFKLLEYKLNKKILYENEPYSLHPLFKLIDGNICYWEKVKENL